VHLPFRPLTWLLALAAGLLLVACQPGPQSDPLDAEVAFAFQVTNPEELAGPVFGLLRQPFEGDAFMRAQVEAPSLDALLNAFAESELTADGEVAGAFVAPRAVPRINDALGGGISPKARGPSLWWVFFPPAECPLTATNAVEAALAPVQELWVWDGEAVDEMGYPLTDGWIVLGSETLEEGVGVETWTYEAYLPVVSRAAWSATSAGPCAFETDWGEDFLLDVDLAIDVGWQFLYLRSVRRYDGMAWGYEEEVRSLTLDEVADLGPIGRVEPRLPVMDLSVGDEPSLPRAFTRLFF
jgi:hypothetical protein